VGSVGSITDDWPTEFQKGYLKTILIISTLLFLIPTATADDDFLLKIMQNNWSEIEPEPEKYNDVNECYCPEKNSDFDDSGPENEANGEHYSWDNLYLEKNEFLEVVINPYE